MPRGGKRPGAGRKKKPELPFAAKQESASVLAKLGTKYRGKVLPSEDELWLMLLVAQDLRIRLDSLKYLTDRRDGKPAQPNTHTGKDGGPITLVFGQTFADSSKPK